MITRADSLVARHPDSKYVDEALMLKGLALSRLRQCQAAVAPLGRVSLLPADAEVLLHSGTPHGADTSEPPTHLAPDTAVWLRA